VGRRKDGERTVTGIENFETIASPQIDRFVVGCSTERVCLPLTRRVKPSNFRVVIDGKALQTRFVDISDGWLISLGDGFLA
jgi:hypothetical protein